MSVLCRCVFHFLYVVTVLRYYMSMFFAKLLPYYAVTRFFFHFSNVITLLRYYMILCRKSSILYAVTILHYVLCKSYYVVTLLPYLITLLHHSLEITLCSLQSYYIYYLITLPYYAVTPFFADVSSIFHSLLPITLSNDYVFCKRLMRYYHVTLLRGSLQTCLPFSIRRYKSMFFFYTSRHYEPFFISCSLHIIFF